MFVWIGLSLEDKLSSFSKSVVTYSNKNNLSTPLKNLPLHVSLRISFEIKKQDFKTIEKELINFSNRLSPFEIDFKQIEINNNIVWINCEETDKLLSAHNIICNTLKDKYNIPLHEFDHSFIFHSTIFMDEPDKIKIYADEISKLKIPKSVISDAVLIGVSENGEPETYKIYKIIKI